MDTRPPASVADDELLARVAAGWRIPLDGIRYLPKAAGSYHWVAEAQGRPRYFITVDDLDTKPWIAFERDAAFDGLRAAYATARRLRHDAELRFVVGPLPRADGRVIMRLSDRYTVAVFPFVSGTAGNWGDPLSRAGRAALLHDLAHLHRATAYAGALARRPLELPGRPMLTAALGELDRPWHGGPLSEPARHALAERATDVAAWLSALDALGSRLPAGSGPPVPTHGEPHPGNLIRTGAGFRLVDWDTVALAFPERDLWMLDDGSPDAFGPYEELTGAPVSATAIRYYRLAWDLSDIAYFVALFRSPHRLTTWIEEKWGGYRRLLDGAASEPYGCATR